MLLKEASSGISGNQKSGSGQNISSGQQFGSNFPIKGENSNRQSPIAKA